MDASIPTKPNFSSSYVSNLSIYTHIILTSPYIYVIDIYQLDRQKNRAYLEEDGVYTYGEQEYGGIWGDGCSSSQPSEEDQARIGEDHWLVTGKAGDETCAERDHHDDDDQAALSISFGDFSQAHLCWGFLGERQPWISGNWVRRFGDMMVFASVLSF